MKTLAEIFGRAGYRTGAFLSAAVLEAMHGLDQGFATYDDATARDARFTHCDGDFFTLIPLTVVQMPVV